MGEDKPLNHWLNTQQIREKMKTIISVVCVHPSEVTAAQSCASIMSSLGVALLVFSKSAQMEAWILGASSIRGLSVKRLEASEFLSKRQILEPDQQAAQ